MDQQEIDKGKEKVQPLEDSYKGINRVKFWEGVWIALAVLATQIVAVFIGVLVALPIAGMSDMEGLTSLATGMALILGFPLAVWWILRKRNLEHTAWTWDSSFIALTVIALIMLYAMSYLIGGLIEFIPNYESMLEQYEEMFENINPTLLIIGGAFIGPICEEIIFRGVILKEFLKSYSPKIAIFFSALIFGIIHFIPIQVMTAFFAGLILGYIYYKTRSLWIPIIMHILNNLLAFAFGAELGEKSGREWFGNDLFFILSLLVSALIVYGIYTYLEKQPPNLGNNEIEEYV